MSNIWPVCWILPSKPCHLVCGAPGEAGNVGTGKVQAGPTAKFQGMEPCWGCVPTVAERVMAVLGEPMGGAAVTTS